MDYISTWKALDMQFQDLKKKKSKFSPRPGSGRCHCGHSTSWGSVGREQRSAWTSSSAPHCSRARRSPSLWVCDMKDKSGKDVRKVKWRLRLNTWTTTPLARVSWESTCLILAWQSRKFSWKVIRSQLFPDVVEVATTCIIFWWISCCPYTAAASASWASCNIWRS